MKKYVLTLMLGQLLVCPFKNLNAQDFVKIDSAHTDENVGDKTIEFLLVEIAK